MLHPFTDGEIFSTIRLELVKNSLRFSFSTTALTPVFMIASSDDHLNPQRRG